MAQHDQTGGELGIPAWPFEKPMLRPRAAAPSSARAKHLLMGGAALAVLAGAGLPNAAHAADCTSPTGQVVFDQNGGGGGDGGDYPAQGGDGDGGDAGGTINTSASNIAAGGACKSAVFATSNGGDGGDGGLGFTLFIPPFVIIPVGFGGDGGRGGDGGDIYLTTSGTLSASGEGGHGVHAQSLAGDGGDGGTGAGVYGEGGDGKRGGVGGDITLTNSATITTASDKGQGIFAHTSGGYGGSGGSGLGIGGVGGNGDGAGAGGAINIDHSGSITTQGRTANGILALSVGGFGGSGGAGGGLVAFGGDATSAGDGGAIDVDILAGGSITTNGQFSYGVLA
ncbi:hypothetical protein G3573_06900, partial [Caulobacter sp. 17J65-9]|nr:hypothetical protein [Caulobacter sp. 17J65-9]